jgi:hypothetical protein
LEQDNIDGSVEGAGRGGSIEEASSK